MNFFRENKKIWLSALLVVLIVLALSAFQAHAQIIGGEKTSYWKYLNPLKWIGLVLDAAVEKAVKGISLVITFLGGLLLLLAGYFIDLALAMNSQLLNSLTVHLGWKIVRDVANLGFVLGIIIIAFATIIRNQTYGMKQILWKFIVMAILVNFSLSICGVFIDMGGVATDFFISKTLSGGASGFSAALSSAFQPQRLLDVKTFIDKSASEHFDSVFVSIASLFFIIIFTFLAVVAFFALAVMLFIRFVYLAILLIVAPMAWLTWVFPGISVGGQGSLWSTWWQEFIRWIFFAPIVSFFMYLAIATMKLKSAAESAWLDQAINQASGAASAGDAISKSLFISSGNKSFSVIIGEMVVFLALMYGGIIAANKMGIHGAAGAQRVVGWGTKQLKSIGIGAAKGTGSRILRAGSREDAATGEVTTGAQRLTSQLATMKGVGRFFRPMADKVSQTAAETRKKVSEEQKKKVSTRTEADNLNRLNSFTRTADPQKMAEAYIEAVKKGYDDKILLPQLAQLDEFIKQTGKAQEFAAARDAYRKSRAEFYEAESKFDPLRLINRASTNLPERSDDAAELFKAIDKAKKLNDLQRQDPNAFMALVNKLQSVTTNPEDRKLVDKILPHQAADIPRASVSITENDAINVNVRALENHNVINYLRPAVIEKILKDGSAEQQVALRRTLRQLVPANISRDLVRAEKDLADVQKALRRVNERGEAYKQSAAGQAEITAQHLKEDGAQAIKDRHLADPTVKKISGQIAELEKKGLM